MALPLQRSDFRLSLGPILSVLAIAYFVLWGCMPIAQGPAMIPLADDQNTQRSVEIGGGDLGELSTGLYGGLQYTSLRPPGEENTWSRGWRMLASFPELDGQFYSPTVGLGFITRRALKNSENMALQLEIGGLWAGISVPMSRPLGSRGLLLLQPGIQLAGGHSYEMIHLPIGAAFPVGDNLWLSLQGEFDLESHLGWRLQTNLEPGGSNQFPLLEPGYSASVGLHWQKPKWTRRSDADARQVPPSHPDQQGGSFEESGLGVIQ